MKNDYEGIFLYFCHSHSLVSAYYQQIKRISDSREMSVLTLFRVFKHEEVFVADGGLHLVATAAGPPDEPVTCFAC